MHPGDDQQRGQWREQDYTSSDEERKGGSPSEWKECSHTEQHHALLRLPASIHSIHYNSRRVESNQHDHRPPVPLVSPSPVYAADNRYRSDHLGYSTVFSANPFGQDRRQRFPHQPLHQQQQQQFARIESPPVRGYDIASSDEYRSTPPRAGKASLSFILDSHDEPEEKGHTTVAESSLSQLNLDDSSARGEEDDDSSDYSLDRYTGSNRSQSGGERRTPPSAAREAGARKGAIKKSRICKIDNCTRYVVNKGLCIGHGGGKRCAIVGCTSSAKNMGVCWKHGGSTKCTIEGCDNRAKSRGVCWSHGGGRKCKEDSCIKTAVSNGLCWAHGGGKRCIVDGCKKPAYERNGNLCAVHQASHVQSA